MYPLLSLSQINIDADLARRLPRRLAYYHLALPLAQDDDALLTVAMAYPENQRVLEVIRTTLGVSAITPVRSPAAEIRKALDLVWGQDAETQDDAVMCWSAGDGDLLGLQQYAQQIAAALSLEFVPSAAQSLDDFIAHIRKNPPVLAICEVTDAQVSQTLLANLPTSILFVRGVLAYPHKILHALRGHTPDKRVLDWIIPLAQHYNAQITLLAATTSLSTKQGNPLMSDFARLILPEHPAQVVEYGQMLASMNLHGRIKIADGTLETAVLDVLQPSAYDLIAIAIEHDGQFVKNMLERLLDNPVACLVIKP